MIFLLFAASDCAQLVAKLKSVFDRFDSAAQGCLRGAQIEQLLLYMNRPVDSVQVNSWLTALKDSDEAIDFPEFVGQYSVRRPSFSPHVPIITVSSPSHSSPEKTLVRRQHFVGLS